VPTTLQALIEHPGWAETDVSSLRAVTTGSTQVPQPLIDAVETRGVPVLQVYGSTETSPIAVYTRLDGDLGREGSTGLPGLACEARIVDDAGRELPHGARGEVVVRGPNVLFEYWGNAAATAETLREGWFRTGDIGSRDADGYFYIHDRKNNVIISGAENIYPAEIERVLAHHPAVAEVAVIGRPDAKWQEVPVAYVVPRAGTATDAEALREGWFHTGDIGTRDADGYFYIHDRKNNVIISGAENIYPAEIERVLAHHPAVAEAAVVGRPEPKWQEVPMAYVVPRAGVPADAQALQRHVAEHLARFKVPREIIFVDSLPKNALGKVQHFRLREATAVP